MRNLVLLLGLLTVTLSSIHAQWDLESTDTDRNWNALSLPFVVGPHGRIGRLNPRGLAP